MRFRLPQPLHGWREFFGEVGIIVLGVLIALSAGQLVERWQWRQQVKQADEVFQNEMGAATTNAYMHLAAEPCLTSRLNDIAAKLNQRAANWRAMTEKFNSRGLPITVPEDTIAIPYHGSPRRVAITTEGWSNALASGTVNHLPYVRAVTLSEAYAAARQLSDDEREERKAVARLLPLGTDRFLDAESRVVMLQDLSDIRRITAEIHSDSENLLLAAKQAGLGYTDTILNGNNAVFLGWERTLRGACVRKPDLPFNPNDPNDHSIPV